MAQSLANFFNNLMEGKLDRVCGALSAVSDKSENHQERSEASDLFD